ncbi:MAG: hypothetical protein B6A08_19295 [Sorangiineae bacterium NIC37A_2]|jgi:UTP--glucose-1-phosphate uridylyltransferase|nr:MAG: hypothetical protein B6A08_19295 [Sorangiineae bacterium NIC37A_2]
MTSGYTDPLAQDLATLTDAERKELEAHGFDASFLVERARLAREGTFENRVRGKVAPPSPKNLLPLPERGTPEARRLEDLGETALREGRCALAVLAGGMATRMGGVVKALVEALPGSTFLDLRLAEQAALTRRYGKRPPLWLMTSQPTHGPIVSALGPRLGDGVEVFRQGLNVRLTEDGRLFRDSSGSPSFYAPGHGDFPDALARSGLLGPFLENGGQYVLVSNLDNLGGGLDPLVIGFHLDSGADITCEVVQKRDADRGGVPVDYEGRTVILEEFRLPEDFDAHQVRVFNVNTLAFTAKALDGVKIPWTYFEVKKETEGKRVLQFERLIHELTFHLETRYAVVPREGTASRFLPVKDQKELAARAAEIEQLARARGMLSEKV